MSQPIKAVRSTVEQKDHGLADVYKVQSKVQS